MEEREDAELPPLVLQERALVSMNGYRVIATLEQFDRSNKLFTGNLAELRSVLDSMQDPGIALPILDIRRPDLHDAFLAKCERHLHNVACAAMSRVDHHRRLLGKTVSPVLAPLEERYRGRVREFAGSGLAQFVQGLRNHLVHRGFPRMLSVNSFGAESWTIQACLDRDHLAGWNGWSTLARDWLMQQGESVDILDTLRCYEQMIIEFDQWICERLVEIHQDDLQAYEAARQSYDTAYMREFDF